MALTNAQLQTLRAAIDANPTLSAYPNDSQGALDMCNEQLNQPASPAFKVWRTSVSRVEIYNETSEEGTNWNWTFYKNQSAVEQNAWTQMFMGDQANFAKANLRAGIAVIFTSASSANATHALAIGKRNATLGEKILATGAGTVASPAVMGYEGAISYADVQTARSL